MDTYEIHHAENRGEWSLWFASREKAFSAIQHLRAKGVEARGVLPPERIDVRASGAQELSRHELVQLMEDWEG